MKDNTVDAHQLPPKLVEALDAWCADFEYYASITVYKSQKPPHVHDGHGSRSLAWLRKVVGTPREIKEEVRVCVKNNN